MTKALLVLVASGPIFFLLVWWVVAFATTTSPQAQTPVVIHGAGAKSCGTYVSAYDTYRPFSGGDGQIGGIAAMQASAAFWQYEEWIDGYLVGVASWNMRPIRDYDRTGMQLWIYNYCRQKPLDVVANAALALYKELGGVAAEH
jgi:hypothetical protein